MERDIDGKIICPHNQGCSCDIPDCDKCGWNPVVAEHRLKKYKEGLGMFEKKYKIPFTGYCEVYARDEEEALEKAENIEDQYFAEYDYGEPICLEKEEENEVD